jgi:hypothetical protein
MITWVSKISKSLLGNQSRSAGLYRFPTRPLGEQKRLVSPAKLDICASRKTNFLLTDCTLTLDFKNAWKILAFRKTAAQSAAAKTAETENFSGLRCLLNEIRTFFKENPDSEF